MSSSALEVGADGDLERQDLLPLVSKKKALVWPSLLGDQEHAVGGLHDGVDLVGVGDEHVLELERETARARTCPSPIETRLASGKLPRAGMLQHRDCCEIVLPNCRLRDRRGRRSRNRR